jgi:hypothetical protein
VHTSSAVTLDGKKYEVTRAKLRRWLQLEDIREKLARAADRRDRNGIIASIYSYLSVALSVEIDFSPLPWNEVIDAFIEADRINRPIIKFPFLSVAARKEEIPWSYEGRTWYAWAHLLSNHSGWSLEYIAELDVDDALALIQEIKTTEQLEREWDWMLSERSVVWDKRGKGRVQHLSRPEWMERKPPAPDEKERIKAKYIPVGNIFRWNSEHTDD